MFRATLGLLAIALPIAAAPAPTPEKEPSKPISAVVRLRDGSLVHVTIAQKDLEVETKYGVLIVPLADVRRVEFGGRFSPEDVRQLNQWLIDLSAKDHALRDAAQNGLIGMGPKVFWAVTVRNTVEKTLEGKKRLTALIRAMEEKYPKDKLKTDDRDFIHTSSFPVVGMVKSPTIKVTSKHFGDITLKPGDLESIRLAGTDSRDFTLRYGTADWTDTEMHLDGGDRLYVTASGSVDLWPAQPGQFLADPNGNQTNWHNGFPAGALLGKIGAGGTPFRVGDAYTVTGSIGRLYLKINGSPWQNAPGNGSYKARVEVKD